MARDDANQSFDVITIVVGVRTDAQVAAPTTEHDARSHTSPTHLLGFDSGNVKSNDPRFERIFICDHVNVAYIFN